MRVVDFLRKRAGTTVRCSAVSAMIIKCTSYVVMRAWGADICGTAVQIPVFTSDVLLAPRLGPIHMSAQ